MRYPISELSHTVFQLLFTSGQIIALHNWVPIVLGNLSEYRRKSHIAKNYRTSFVLHFCRRQYSEKYGK